jgi:hypothetical protein
MGFMVSLVSKCEGPGLRGFPPIPRKEAEWMGALLLPHFSAG